MRHTKFLILITVLAILGYIITTNADDHTSLTSPDGDINVSFNLSQEGIPHYQVSAYGQAVINDSGLGLEAEETELSDGFTVKKIRRSAKDEQWEQPWKVIARTGPYLLHPETLYECTGDVPNVCFPCAAVHDPETGRVAVYYGTADTVVGLAFGYIDEILEFTKKTSIL